MTKTCFFWHQVFLGSSPKNFDTQMLWHYFSPFLAKKFMVLINHPDNLLLVNRRVLLFIRVTPLPRTFFCACLLGKPWAILFRFAMLAGIARRHDPIMTAPTGIGLLLANPAECPRHSGSFHSPHIYASCPALFAPPTGVGPVFPP